MSKSLFARILPAVALVCGMGLFANDEPSTLQTFMENANVLLDSSLHLDLSQSLNYNDNVDEDGRPHRSGNWSTKTSLDASIIKNFNNNSFGVKGGVAYKHDFHKGKNDDSKGFTYYVAPILNGNYRFGRNVLRLTAISEYKSTELDRSQRMTVMEAINGATLAWSNEITGKTVLALTADYKNKHFSDSKFKSYNNQVYGVKFAPYWNASERTRVGMTLAAQRTQYNHNEAHDNMNRYNVGAYTHYQVTSRTNVFVEVGAEQIKYEHGTISKRNSDDGFKFYAKAGANYIATDDIKFRFDFSRSQEDSWGVNARGLRTEYSASAAALWKLTGKLTMVNKFSYDFADEKSSTSDADEYDYSLNFSYKFNDSLSFNAGYSLTIVDYDHKKGDYLVNEIGIGATWRIK